MPKRSRTSDEDENEMASRVVSEATKKKPKPKKKNPAAVALGRLGGLKGGDARAKKLPPEKRAEIARKAARKRWGHDQEDES